MNPLRISNNTALPGTPAFGVKSFWLMLLTVIVTALNGLGIDLIGSLCDVGLGCTPADVIATGERAVSAWQALLPIVTAVWMWIERRAPNFRLTLWGGK